MLRWPGNVLHLIFLIIVLLVCGIVYGLARLGIALFVWGKRRGPAVGTLRGWMLKQAMSTLGATFIKLGQVMSTRPDLFAPEVIEQLRSLQDRIPPFGFRKIILHSTKKAVPASGRRVFCHIRIPTIVPCPILVDSRKLGKVRLRKTLGH